MKIIDTLEEAINLLERHNLWRRGAEHIEATDPKQLGIAIDKVVEAFRCSVNTPKTSVPCDVPKEGARITGFFKIEEKVPYLIMGGKPISNAASKFEEAEFYKKMEEVIGAEKYAQNEKVIREHLKKPDSFIEFGNFIFSRR